MPTKTIVACLLCGLVAPVADATAQTTDPAFTATGRSCADIVWQPDVLATYPDIGRACQEVVQRDGRDYVRFIGTVQSVSPGGGRMTIRFNDTDEAVALETPDNLRLYVDGRQTRVSQLQRGAELTFHVPANQFVAHFFEPGSETRFVAARLLRLSALQEIAAANAAAQNRTLPQTAGILPLVGLLGVILIAVGGALMKVVSCARR